MNLGRKKYNYLHCDGPGHALKDLIFESGLINKKKIYFFLPNLTKNLKRPGEISQINHSTQTYEKTSHTT